MKTRTYTPVLAALLAVLATPSAAAEKHQKVQLTTADGVQLAAFYRPGSLGNKSPVVLVLDGIGTNRRPKVCDAVAVELHKLGCATLCFDFRGNGASKGVSERFWDDPTNRRMVRGYKPKAVPEAIDAADFKAGYYRSLVNDVAGARAFLDRRNDVGECNTRQMLVVGLREGAAVGAMWVATEWHRYRVTGGFEARFVANPEGRDVVGCLWVDPALEIDRQRVPFLDCVKRATAKRTATVDLFHATGDVAQAKFARQCADAVNAGRNGALSRTVELPVEAGERVSDKSELPAALSKAVAGILESQDPPPWDDRDFKDRRYAWAVTGGAVLAKEEDEEAFRPVPVDRLVAR